MVLKIEPIAILKGCFPQKFGVPRQAGIVKSATGTIYFYPKFNRLDFIEGLEQFSHIWLIFNFHQNQWKGDSKVRPQRLGGNKRMGVFATRSPYRPNGIGLSAVEIVKINYANCTVEVASHDLVTDTPIYDIKPYIPFTDSIPQAVSLFADKTPEIVNVTIAADITECFFSLPESTQQLIIQVIEQNPIPVFHSESERIYGVQLLNLDIQFVWKNHSFLVIAIEEI